MTISSKLIVASVRLPTLLPPIATVTMATVIFVVPVLSVMSVLCGGDADEPFWTRKKILAIAVRWHYGFAWLHITEL